MKNKLPENILLPFLVGIAFCLFVIMGFNAAFFSGNIYWNIFAIFLGVIVLYVSLWGIIKNPANLLPGMGGFHFGRIFLSFVILFTVYIFQKFFRTETPEYKSLLEKENVHLLPDFEECHKVKYGKFLAGVDTITRSRDQKKDIEEVIDGNGTHTYSIKWLDSCSYYRIEEETNSVVDVVKLGNFEGVLHDMYVRPAALHYIDEEKILKVLPLELQVFD